MPLSATNYSTVGGGGRGYVNIGGWNTTLTDTATSAKEVCGVVRFEGANSYIYAKAGSASCASQGIYSLCTALTDGSDDNLAAPIRLTALPIASMTVALAAFAMGITTVATGAYGWFLRAGITTLYMNSDLGGTALYNLSFRKPSTATLSLWDSAATACGFAFCLQDKTTAQASAGGTGVLCYVNFASPRGA